MASGKKNTVGIVTDLVRPITDELGLDLWDVRFEKEGSTWYLRIFLDKEEGVNIDDCENVSRRLSPILDETDPIVQSYTSVSYTHLDVYKRQNSSTSSVK